MSDGKMLLILAWGKLFRIVAFAAFAIALGSPLTSAANRYWTATVEEGDWSTAAYWGGTEPTSADWTYIENGGTALITEFGEVCNGLQLGISSPGKSNSVRMTGGDLTATNIGILNGVFDQSGGINTITASVSLANENSEYRLSGTGVLTAGYLLVGSDRNKEATFIQSGGSNTIASTLNVGFPTNSIGSYEMHGGLLSARDAQIGYSGTGTFTQTAGVNSVSDQLTLGYNANSSGTYHLSGAGQLTANAELLTFGTFNQTGGVNQANSVLIGVYGDFGGSPPVPGNFLYNLTGPGQLNADYETIGGDAIGKFVQTAGVHTIRLYFNLGATGTYELSGTGQFTTSGSENISGTFKHSSGIHNAGAMNLGTDANTTGTYELSGTGILRSSGLVIGSSGTGIFMQSGGIHKAGTIQLGGNSQTSSIYHLTGGILEVQKIFANYAANFAFNFGGGTIRPPITNPPVGLNLQIPAMTLTGIGGDAKIDMPYVYTTYSGSMSGEGGLRKLGAGTLKLSGANTYAGSTTVENGTLHVKKAASLANYGVEGKVVVEGGATLALKAGASGEWTALEIETAAANADFRDGSIFGIDTDVSTGDNFTYGNELAGNFHFTKLGSDTLTLTGLIDYPGTTTISGGTLCIATPTSVQANVVLHDIVGTGDLIVGDGVNPTLLTATSINVNSLTIRGASVGTQIVPEPGSIALLLSALAAGMLWLKRFRKHRLVFLAAAMILVPSAFLQAASRYWTATLDECEWSVPEHWGGSEPTSGDDAYITNGSTAYLSENGESCYSLSVGNPGTESTSTLRMTGGELLAPTARVGYSGTGIFDQSGGNVLTSTLNIGYSETKTSENGTYNLSVNAQLSANYVQIGGSRPGFTAYPGTGSFTQLGGINSIAETLGIGIGAGAAGTYRLIGEGQLSAKNETVGNRGVGTFIHSAGINTVSETFIVGNYANSAPTANSSYVLSGSGQLTAYTEAILFGSFDQAGGINSAVTLDIGCSGGSTYPPPVSSTYNLSGSGQLSVLNSETIGGAWTSGTFTQTGGIHTVGETLSIGSPVTSASYILGGTGMLSTKTETIGSGKGSFSQTGGMHSVAGTLTLGNGSSSVGTYELSGNGQLLAGNVTIGSSSAAGTFTQSGGTNRILGTLTLSNPSATYNLTGGTLIVKTPPNSATGKFNFGGGTLLPTSMFVTMLPMTLTGVGGDAKIDTRQYLLTLNGSLTGAGGLKKLGGNGLTIAGENSYSGGTTVEEGELRAMRAVSLPGFDTAGKVVVKKNGMLTVDGGESRWTSAEIHSLTANAAFDEGSTFGVHAYSSSSGAFVYDNPLAGNFSLNKLGAGTLTLAGAIDYPGKTTISSGTLCIATPESVQANVVLHDIVGAGDLIVGDGMNPTTLTATSIQVNSLTIRGTSGGAAVPEPSACILFCSALAVGAFWRRIPRMK